MEIWKDIEGYEGYYQISNKCRVKSLARYVDNFWGTKQFVRERILKQIPDRTKHLRVILSVNGIHKTYQVHQLFAQAFLPNPNGYDVVHHKNHNPQDNRIENLEWMDRIEHNRLHSNDSKEITSKGVDQIDTKTGEVLHQWDSTQEVERKIGFPHQLIGKCCNGGFYSKSREKWVNMTQSNGYAWKYVAVK